MTITLYVCQSPDCPVVFFKTRDGCCAKCGELGRRVFWALRPPHE